MDSDEDSMVYILPHIPKTAGQTLRFHFSKHLLVHDTYIHLGPWGQKNEQQMRLTPWSKRSFIERSRVKVISGHNVKKNEVISLLPGIDIKFATFLRDPADRWISQ